MTRAVDAVLAIPELLESILFEFPARDLLLATRVNREFRDCINSSNKIQCKLCFKPPQAQCELFTKIDESIYWESDPALPTNYINPFLPRIIDLTFRNCDITVSANGVVRMGKIGAALHVSTGGKSDQAVLDNSVCILPVAGYGDTDMEITMYRPGRLPLYKRDRTPSWWKMLVAHQPMDVIVEYKIPRHRRKAYRVSRVLSFKTSTVSDLVDKIAAPMEKRNMEVEVLTRT